ncbi:MAG: hypothetical protein ABJB66_00720 [Gemmatimonadaceae bacterium]
MRVEFIVDELVLIGFDPRERHRITDAIERELVAQLKQVQGANVAASAYQIDGESTVRAPDVRLNATVNSPNAIARGVSRSIVGAVVARGAQAPAQRGTIGIVPSQPEGR